jgi:hypothetical protein
MHYPLHLFDCTSSIMASAASSQYWWVVASGFTLSALQDAEVKTSLKLLGKHWL